MSKTSPSTIWTLDIGFSCMTITQPLNCTNKSNHQRYNKEKVTCNCGCLFPPLCCFMVVNVGHYHHTICRFHLLHLCDVTIICTRLLSCEVTFEKRGTKLLRAQGIGPFAHSSPGKPEMLSIQDYLSSGKKCKTCSSRKRRIASDQQPDCLHYLLDQAIL